MQMVFLFLIALCITATTADFTNLLRFPSQGFAIKPLELDKEAPPTQLATATALDKNWAVDSAKLKPCVDSFQPDSESKPLAPKR